MKKIKQMILMSLLLIISIFLGPSIVKANWVEDGLNDGSMTTGHLARSLTGRDENGNEISTDDYFTANADVLLDKLIKEGNDIDGTPFDNPHEICIDVNGDSGGQFVRITSVIDVFFGNNGYTITTYSIKDKYKDENGNWVLKVDEVNNVFENGAWDKPQGDTELSTFIKVAIAAHLAGDASGDNTSDEKYGIYYGGQLMCENYWLNNGTSVMGVSGVQSDFGEAVSAKDMLEEYGRSHDLLGTSYNNLHVRMLVTNGYDIDKNKDEEGNQEQYQNQLIYASRYEESKQKEMKVTVEKRLINAEGNEDEIILGANVQFNLYKETSESIPNGFTKITRGENYYLYKNADNNTIDYIEKDNRLYKICENCLKTTDRFGKVVYNISYDPNMDNDIHYIVEEVGGDGIAGYEWYGESYYINWADGSDDTSLVQGCITVPPLDKSDVQDGISEDQNSKVKSYYIYVKNKEQNKGKARVHIIKRDKDNKKPLKGAIFSIWRGDAKVTESKETNDEGIVDFEIAEPGDNYIIKEEKAPPGYKINGDGDIPLTISQAQVTQPDKYPFTRYIDNEKEYGAKVTVIKKARDTDETLAGAKIYLAFKKNGKFTKQTETKTTDEEGKVEFYISDPGTYYVYESKAPNGYYIINSENGTKYVTISNDDITRGRDFQPITIYNKPGTIIKKKYLTIVKKDEDTGTNENGNTITRKLPNTTFVISEEWTEKKILTQKEMWESDWKTSGYMTWYGWVDTSHWGNWYNTDVVEDVITLDTDTIDSKEETLISNLLDGSEKRPAKGKISEKYNSKTEKKAVEFSNYSKENEIKDITTTALYKVGYKYIKHDVTYRKLLVATTDEDGRIILDSDYIEDEDATFTVKEIIPNEEYDWDVNKRFPGSVNVKVQAEDYDPNAMGGTLTIDNTRNDIDLTGYIWLDGYLNDKDTTSNNNLYKEGNGDQNDVPIDAKDINIKLYKNGVDTGKTPKYEEWEDGKLKYRFEDLDYQDIDQYHVEFEYNGLKYEPVETNQDVDTTGNSPTLKGNGSRAKELTREELGNRSELSREEFNERYDTINGVGSVDDDDDGNNETYEITYAYNPKANNNTSKLKNGISYQSKNTSENSKAPEDRNAYMADKQYAMIASTEGVYEFTNDGDNNNTESLEDRYEEGCYTLNVRSDEIIDNVNFGIRLREQPDLALYKDLDTVKIDVNGKSNTYSYAMKRSTNETKLYKDR